MHARLLSGTSLTAIRWLVAISLVGIGVMLGTLVVGDGGPQRDGLVHVLGLLVIALAVYAWVLYPTVGSVWLSAAVVLGVAWAWAVSDVGVLGLDLGVLVVLVAIAALERRRWSQRLARMAQRLDDLEEQRTVKNQALDAAKQTRQAMQRKHARYAQLQSVAEELSNMTDLSSISKFAVDRAFSLIGKSGVCLLFLVEPGRQELSLVASKRQERIPSVASKHGDQFDRYVLRSHRPLLVNDVSRDFRFTTSLARERQIGSVIGCPLLRGQSAEGVLRLDSSQPGAYTQDDLRFLDILLNLLGTAVTNARLFEQTQRLAMTDGLTGLTLRRPFLEQLGRELTRAGRSREPASVLIIDVDQFKDYNDTFGHMAGDAVLKHMAEILRTAVPPDGVSARYGGEEFAVLLPRTPRKDAKAIAERIRQTAEQQLARSARRERAVTISVGLSTFPEDAHADLELIRVADGRLYQAKRAGRNLVCAS